MKQSPITGGTAIEVEKKISTSYIIQSYLDSYGIDVKSLFGGLKEIEVLNCKESGFRFYGPGQVAGDSDFYAALQEFPWYYMDWKWEHQVIKDALPANSKILEIGCAKGAFISRLENGVKAVGLELNEKAAAEAKENGLDVRTETIQDHAIANPGTYDMVCSFQVMEHVTDVKGIVEASVIALKPGGKLVISVPNNDSFIKYSPDSILNMPPHHMNLWDENSLSRLQEFFAIDLMELKREPLQKYHYPVVVNNFIEKNISNGVLGKGLKKLIKWTRAYKLMGLVKNKIKGHSIIAFYSKK